MLYQLIFYIYIYYIYKIKKNIILFNKLYNKKYNNHKKNNLKFKKCMIILLKKDNLIKIYIFIKKISLIIYILH